MQDKSPLDNRGSGLVPGQRKGGCRRSGKYHAKSRIEQRRKRGKELHVMAQAPATLGQAREA